MPAARFRTFEEWQRLILAGLVARGGLSDVSQAGVARTLCAALAQCLDDLSYNAANLRLAFGVDTAAGPDLDARAQDIVPGTLQRLTAQPATALLTFSRLAPSGQVTIPAGTQVQTADGILFATVADASVDGSTLSISGVAARALLPGAAGNVAAGSLNTFASKPLGIDTVDQPAAATSGQDQETDDAFRQRIYIYVAGLSAGTVESLVSNVQGQVDPATGDQILYASVVEYPTTRPAYSELYVADAAGTNQGVSVPVTTPENLTAGRLGPPADTAEGGETRLPVTHKPVDTQAAYALTSSTRGTLRDGIDYKLEPASGIFYLTSAATQGEKLSATYAYHTGIVALAQKIVDGDPADQTNYPGVRMAGSVVRVLSPQLVLQSVTASVITAAGYDHGTLRDAASAAVSSHLAALPIGGNVVLAKMIAAVMNIAGVTDVRFTQPAADVLTAPNQLVRPGNVMLS